MILAVTIALGGCLLALGALTGAGERRRGASAAVVALAAAFFPVTWLVWYLRDERPYCRGAAQPH